MTARRIAVVSAGLSNPSSTRMLADRLAMPVPHAPMDSQTDAAYWTASGPAEWVIRHVVDVNAGRSARTERRMCDADPDGRLTFPSLCVGGVRDARARFDARAEAS